MGQALALGDEHLGRGAVALGLAFRAVADLQLPPSAVMSNRPIDAAGGVELRAVPGTVAVSGFVDYDSTERAVRRGNSTRWVVADNSLFSERMRLRLQLMDDEWAARLCWEGG